MKIVYLFYRLRSFTWYLINKALCSIPISYFKKQQKSFDPYQDFQSRASVTPPRIWLDLLQDYPAEWTSSDCNGKDFRVVNYERSEDQRRAALNESIPNESVVIRGLKRTNDSSMKPMARKLKISSNTSAPIQKSESISETNLDEVYCSFQLKRIEEQGAQYGSLFTRLYPFESEPQQPRASFSNDAKENWITDLSSDSDTTLPNRSSSVKLSERIQDEIDSSSSVINIDTSDVFSIKDLSRDLQTNSCLPSGHYESNFRIHHWQGGLPSDNGHAAGDICQIAQTTSPILPWESLLQDTPKKEGSSNNPLPWPELISEVSFCNTVIDEMDGDGTNTRQIQEQRGYKWNVLRLY